MDRRLPAAAALLVAVLLVTTPQFLFPHAGQAEYHHSVERIDEGEIPEEVDVRRYGELSPEAKRAFDAALAAPDRRATVHGEANRPPDLFYSDYADYGQGIYVIEKGGTHYRLETLAGGGIFPGELFAVGALAVLAGAVAVVGGAGWHRGRARAPAVAAGGGLAVLLAVAAASTGVGDVAGLLLALLAVPAGWLAVGATHRARTAVGAAAATGGLVVAAAWATETGGPVAVIAGTAAVGLVAAALGAGGRAARRRLG